MVFTSTAARTEMCETYLVFADLREKGSVRNFFLRKLNFTMTGLTKIWLACVNLTTGPHVVGQSTVVTSWSHHVPDVLSISALG